jgi:hypothetical protein
MTTTAIKFPLFHTPEISVEFFPDELPEDHNDVIDCLRLELAPLKIWKTCAVSDVHNVNLYLIRFRQLEYYKQGEIQGFDAVLQDIVNELKNPGVFLLVVLSLFLTLCKFVL